MSFLKNKKGQDATTMLVAICIIAIFVLLVIKPRFNFSSKFNPEKHICINSTSYENCTGAYRDRYTFEKNCSELDEDTKVGIMNNYLNGCHINCTKVYYNSINVDTTFSAIYLSICKDANHTEIMKEVEDVNIYEVD